MGRVLVGQARTILSGAARFEALAAGTREGLEPELAVAIDPLVPTAAFIDSLRALRREFPYLPVSFSTEGLGGAERRLRRGDAALALCILLPSVPDDVAALPLLGINLVPVVSPAHPLAGLDRPATRADLDEHVQLVLSDPAAPDGPSYGVMSTRAWRFVELGRRLDFLLAGLGWCRMPEHLVTPHLTDGRLVSLAFESDPARAMGPLTIYAAHMRDRSLGRAGGWLLSELQARLALGGLFRFHGPLRESCYRRHQGSGRLQSVPFGDRAPLAGYCASFSMNVRRVSANLRQRLPSVSRNVR